MKLTQKLVGFLHRAFNRDPADFLALRLRYDGGMTWRVEDAVLYTSVTGGSGAALEVDLTQYTLGELANYLSAQPGYSVPFRVTNELSLLGARILLDGSGNQDKTNGDHLRAFTSLTWAYLDANAVELKAAREQIYQMLRQMTVVTGEGDWLDEIGGYYNVRRRDGEVDSLYGPRIIEEVIRPRNNNKAIEIAISRATGGLQSRVVDVEIVEDVFPAYNGDISFDGTYQYSATSKYRRNLFDVEYAFDLEGAEDIAPFQRRVLMLIDNFRAAGTHRRQILLTAGRMDDTGIVPTDGALALQLTSAFVEAVAVPTDIANVSATLVLADSALPVADDETEITLLSAHTYNGARRYGGSGRLVYYNSGSPVVEPF